MKNTENLLWYWSPNRYLKSRPPKYEVGKLSTRLRCLVTCSYNCISMAVPGNTLYSRSARHWFESLDTSQMGLVWWEEVLDHVMEKIGSRCVVGLVNPVETHIDIFNMPHCKVRSCLQVLQKVFVKFNEQIIKILLFLQRRHTT